MKILALCLSSCIAAASCSRPPPAATNPRFADGVPGGELLSGEAGDRENARIAIEGIRVPKKKGGRRLPPVAAGDESGPARPVTADGAGELKGRIEGWMISDQVIDFGNESLHAAECMANASQIISACRLFANDHGGNYPLVLSDLVPEYLRNPSVFGTSRFPNPNEIGYEYFGGKVADPSSTVLLRGCYTTTDGKRTVFRVDGSGTRERP